MTNRKAVPHDTVTEVLFQSRRRCCICFGLNRDFNIKSGQIAHLDKDNTNNRFDNLAFMCFNHHDMYDSQTSQSKGWTEGEAKKYRDMLYEYVKTQLVIEDRLDQEEPQKHKLRVWQYKPLAFHYVNLPRLLAIHASFSGTVDSPIKSEHVDSIRRLTYDNYHNAIAFTTNLLRQWHPKVLNPHVVDNLNSCRVGCAFDFSFAEFRTKNIRFWNGKSQKPKTYSEIDRDPHLYYTVGDLKAYLPLDYSWITTDTAFFHFRPRNGIARNLSGLAILKYVEDSIAVFTPLVLGTYNLGVSQFGGEQKTEVQSESKA